jgi:hypothetical protein
MFCEFAKVVGELWRAMFDAYQPELHYMRGPGPKWHAKHWVTTTDAILRGPPTVLDLWGSRPSQQALCINCCGLRSGFGWKKTNFVASRMPIPIGIDIEVRYGARRRGEPNLGLVLGGKVSD